MADADKSIVAGGGADYTTCVSFVNAADVSAGYWHGTVNDNSDYDDENIVFGAPTGTPTAANNVELRGGNGNRHLGILGAACRVRDGVGHVLTASSQFVSIQDLEIVQTGTGTSDEGIRVASGAEDILISKCIIRSDIGATQQDGIYAAAWTATIHVDNCILLNWDRGGFHSQNSSGSASHIWNLEFNAVNACGADNTNLTGGVVNRDNSSGTNTWNVWNNWAIGNSLSNSDDWQDGTGGAGIWNGGNNIAGDLTIEGKTTASYDSVVLTATDPASGENVHVTTIGATPNYTIVEEDTETVTQFGRTDRAGNESAPQTTGQIQDFGTDIKHANRGTTTVSIGPFELVEAGGGATQLLTRMQYAA